MPPYLIAVLLIGLAIVAGMAARRAQARPFTDYEIGDRLPTGHIVQSKSARFTFNELPELTIEASKPLPEPPRGLVSVTTHIRTFIDRMGQLP